MSITRRPGVRWDQCRDCGELIVWATTPGGKRLPFDPYVRVWNVMQRFQSRNGNGHYDASRSDIEGDCTCHLDTCRKRPPPERRSR